MSKIQPRPSKLLFKSKDFLLDDSVVPKLIQYKKDFIQRRSKVFYIAFYSTIDGRTSMMKVDESFVPMLSETQEEKIESRKALYQKAKFLNLVS